MLPQRRRQAVHRRKVDAIAPGDEIVTSGGIYGFVRGIGDDDLTLEIAEGTNVRVAKQAVAIVLEREPADEPETPSEPHVGG